MNMKLRNLNQQGAQVVIGTYRITGRVAQFYEDGIAAIKLRLSASDGDLIAYAPTEGFDMPQNIEYLELVHVRGTRVAVNDAHIILVTELRRSNRTEVDELACLHSLPKVLCPASSSFDLLIKAVRSLESPHLKQFLKRVLERRDRMETFLKAPASKNYHHAYPGGLLVHSLDVAKTVVGMIRLSEPQMPRLLQETAFVAGLLHDIGKTYTFDAQGRYTATSKLCGHDSFTLEACAYGLAYLDRHEPELAITLRHIWTCASPGARYGSPAAMTLARYVRDADGQSAMANNQRNAFNSRRTSGFGRLGNNVYWLPGATQGGGRGHRAE
jgi:3'-5' exoribonuclease